MSDGNIGSLKAGFAGDEAPLVVIPNMVGKIRKSLKLNMVCYKGFSKCTAASKSYARINSVLQRSVEWDTKSSILAMKRKV
jgi:actin-related protein